MLRRLLLLQVPILKVLSDRQVSKRDDVLLDLLVYQWSLAEEWVKVLGPFEVATTMLSAEYNVSLSCVLPIMDGLRNSLQGATDDLPENSDSKASTCRANAKEIQHLDTVSFRSSHGSFVP